VAAQVSLHAEKTSARCVSKPPYDWVLAEARWGICGQRDECLAESLQARPGAREPSMVTVDDPEALRHCGLQHALIIHAEETWPVRKSRRCPVQPKVARSGFGLRATDDRQRERGRRRRRASCPSESEPLPPGPGYLRVSATEGEPWAVRGCSVIELALCPGIIRLAAGRAVNASCAARSHQADPGRLQSRRLPWGS
jgi:hypothetical protein